MLLAELGNDELSKLLTHQIRMGEYFKKLLIENGWTIVGNSPLPVICFTHPEHEDDIEEVLKTVLEKKKVWLSKVAFGEKSALRVCISSFKTQTTHLDILIDELTTAL